MRGDNGGEFWHIVIGAVVGGVGSFVSTLVTGGSLEDALISASFGVASGALTAALPGFGAIINAGFSAAESIVLDVKNMKSENLTVTDIVINATVSAGFGALTGSNDSYFSSKAFVDDFVNVRHAFKKTFKGNHPIVKKQANKCIAGFKKNVLRETKRSLIDYCSMNVLTYGTKELFRAYARHSIMVTR